MSDVSGEMDPIALVAQRVEEMSDARSRLEQAVSNVPTIRNAVAQAEYDYKASLLNQELIQGYVGGSRLYGWGPEAVVFKGSSVVADCLPYIVWFKHVRFGRRYTTPLLTMGEALNIEQENTTNLLLVPPVSYHDRGTEKPPKLEMFMGKVNTLKWRSAKEAAEGVQLTKELVRQTYRPDIEPGSYLLDASTPGVLVAQEGRAKGLFEPETYNGGGRILGEIDTTTSHRKLAKMALGMTAQTVDSRLEPDVFERFRVLQHLLDLSAVFGDGKLLKELLLKREDKMPADAYEQIAGIAKARPALEALEALEATDGTHGDMVDRADRLA